MGQRLSFFTAIFPMLLLSAVGIACSTADATTTPDPAAATPTTEPGAEEPDQTDA